MSGVLRCSECDRFIDLITLMEWAEGAREFICNFGIQQAKKGKNAQSFSYILGHGSVMLHAFMNFI